MMTILDISKTIRFICILILLICMFVLGVTCVVEKDVTGRWFFEQPEPVVIPFDDIG